MSDAAKVLEHTIIHLAPTVDNALNGDRTTRSPEDHPRIGFLLVAFEFSEAGAPLAYITNADQRGLVSALQELIARVGATSRIVTTPIGPMAAKGGS